MGPSGRDGRAVSRSMLGHEPDSGRFPIQDHPGEPTAYSRADDAGPLREALSAISTTGPASDPAYSRTAAPPLVRPRLSSELPPNRIPHW